ncbi:MAG TPA: carbohydrate ABC transporter substrate-binding protein, partial [Sphaerochaeta sp.]|nr:carbohydrate ABC transporter substrate-binding protein [Sphaerochaeta sp.]
MTGKKNALIFALVLTVVAAGLFAQATKEVASDKVQLRVLHYIDMAEPNSANEEAMIWDVFK